MQFFYENQGSNSFLVYKLSDKEELDSFNYGMLANNNIKNIIAPMFSQVDSDRYLKFKISAKISLKQYFEGVVNKHQIVNVFLSVSKALIDTEEYMIDENMFILDPQYIYVDVSTAQASIICFPVVGYSSGVKVYDFFKNIMFTTSFDQVENADYVAKIISFLNSNPNFSILDFRKMLLSIDNRDTKSVAHANNVQQNMSVNVQTQNSKAPEQAVLQTLTQQQQFHPVVNNPVQESKKCADSVTNKQTSNGKLERTALTQKAQPTDSKSQQGVDLLTRNRKTESNDDAADANQPKEKKMSLFYLLNHFSKENLETYKSQSKDNSAPTASATSKDKKAKQIKGNPVAGFGNAIDNASTQMSASSSAQVSLRQNSTPNVSQRSNIDVQSTPFVNNSYVNNIPVQTVQPQSNQADFGGTTVLGAANNAGGTTVLGAVEQEKVTFNPRLIRSKNNEIILINKPVFRIGKENSYVDYFIADNSAISRSHANIIVRDEDFFVVDTNSTNHTYVNGAMIQSNDEVKLNDKDMIRFANEDFEFRIY